MNDIYPCKNCKNGKYIKNDKWDVWYCDSCGQGKEWLVFFEKMELKSKEKRIANKLKQNKYTKCMQCKQISFGEFNQKDNEDYCIICGWKIKRQNFSIEIKAPCAGLLNNLGHSISLIREAIIKNNAFCEYFCGLILSKYLNKKFDNDEFKKLRKSSEPAKDVKIDNNFYEITRVINPEQKIADFKQYINNAFDIKVKKYKNQEKINFVPFCVNKSDYFQGKIKPPSENKNLLDILLLKTTIPGICEIVKNNFEKNKNLFDLNNSFFVNNIFDVNLKCEYILFQHLEKEFTFNVLSSVNDFSVDFNSCVDGFSLLLKEFNLLEKVWLIEKNAYLFFGTEFIEYEDSNLRDITNLLLKSIKNFK